MDMKPLLFVPGLTLSAVLAMALFSESYAADKLYRYRNSEGVLVIDYQVPPQYVSNGYDVLSPTGRLLERIPPYVSDAGDATEKARAVQRAEDNFLLRSYSSVEEIIEARDRKLKTLQREIDNIERNIIDTQGQRRIQERKAADQQRAGREVPKSLLEQMEGLREREEDAAMMLGVRRSELKEAELRFANYISRYGELIEDLSVDTETSEQAASNQ
ncbi:hypothetical protein QP938_00380 [Porticoccaceae bacterium LTM1]|nr:hypothetical protein QP938_00380 [Porticoccaceae bacterium LTM1]